MTGKVPSLVRVTQLAKEHDPPISPEAMLRRLLKIQKALKRTILFQIHPRGPWFADRTFLRRMANDGGKSTWARLREVEQAITTLTLELGDVKRTLAEHGIF